MVVGAGGEGGEVVHRRGAGHAGTGKASLGGDGGEREVVQFFLFIGDAGRRKRNGKTLRHQRSGTTRERVHRHRSTRALFLLRNRELTRREVLIPFRGRLSGLKRREDGTRKPGGGGSFRTGVHRWRRWRVREVVRRSGDPANLKTGKEVDRVRPGRVLRREESRPGRTSRPAFLHPGRLVAALIAVRRASPAVLVVPFAEVLTALTLLTVAGLSFSFGVFTSDQFGVWVFAGEELGEAEGGHGADGERGWRRVSVRRREGEREEKEEKRRAEENPLNAD
jgi:hypothetical protein